MEESDLSLEEEDDKSFASMQYFQQSRARDKSIKLLLIAGKIFH